MKDRVPIPPNTTDDQSSKLSARQAHYVCSVAARIWRKHPAALITWAKQARGAHHDDAPDECSHETSARRQCETLPVKLEITLTKIILTRKM